jgi:hypothetical protein
MSVSEYKPYITTRIAKTKEIHTFAIKLNDFVDRFGSFESARFPNFDLQRVEDQINKGSTFGNRVNCQYIYWHENNQLIPKTEANVIDPKGDDEHARVLVVHEAKDKHGNSITVLFVDTMTGGSRLARLYVYFWLPDNDQNYFQKHSQNDRPIKTSKDTLPANSWKQVFKDEEDSSLFIDEVEAKLARFQGDKTIVMKNNETLHKFY